MPTVIKRRISRVLPADPAQSLLLLRVLPVRHALTELLIVLPATNIRVARCSLDEGARAVLLVVHPVAVVRVAVLEGVQAVAVALADRATPGLLGPTAGSETVVAALRRAERDEHVKAIVLAVDSGGAGEFRGGLGYEKHIRMLKDGHFMSIADRSILACWGVRGGRAGMPFQVVIDPGGPDEREVDALADAEEIKAGQLVRIRTTGGGGWGDPLARDPESVVRDVVWRKVSAEAALRDYGVVLTGSTDADDLSFDASATTAERGTRAAWSRDDDAFFDRGPGYSSLADGAAFAEVDRI